MKSSEHDHGYHARQEKNYDKRVENAKPLYICLWHWLQDVVPPRWPFDGIIHLKQNKEVTDPPVLLLYYSTVQTAAKPPDSFWITATQKYVFLPYIIIFQSTLYTVFSQNYITKMTSIHVWNTAGTAGGRSLSWAHGIACVKAI
jgi:hypothetical protein